MPEFVDADQSPTVLEAQKIVSKNTNQETQESLGMINDTYLIFAMRRNISNDLADITLLQKDARNEAVEAASDLKTQVEGLLGNSNHMEAIDKRGDVIRIYGKEETQELGLSPVNAEAALVRISKGEEIDPYGKVTEYEIRQYYFLTKMGVLLIDLEWPTFIHTDKGIHTVPIRESELSFRKVELDKTGIKAISEDLSNNQALDTKFQPIPPEEPEEKALERLTLSKEAQEEAKEPGRRLWIKLREMLGKARVASFNTEDGQEWTITTPKAIEQMGVNDEIPGLEQLRLDTDLILTNINDKNGPETTSLYFLSPREVIEHKETEDFHTPNQLVQLDRSDIEKVISSISYPLNLRRKD